MSATVVSFGEWLPDQPALNSQGLVEANNVLPDIGHYRPYAPLATLSAGSYTLPATARGLFLAADPTSVRLDIFYAGSDSLLFSVTAAAQQFQTRVAGAVTAGLDWQFAQFENIVFACNHANTLYHTVGATTNFLVSAAPNASVVGVINRFVMVGDLGGATHRPYTVSWSAIDDPLNWPPPNSATATATQSGEQILNNNFGVVRCIIGGDQHGLIFQDNGITRITYVGPPAVFQFDEIEKTKGGLYESIVKAGALTYFISDGFYVTDGVSVTPLGVGKIDKTFLASGTGGGSFNATIQGVFDQRKKMLMWCHSEGASTIASRVIAMNTVNNQWSRANQPSRSVDKSELGSAIGPYAFDNLNVLCSWRVQTSQPINIGTATLTTGDLELNPGARAYVDGIKPNIESSGTAPVVTLRIGSRSDLSTAPSYTATTTPTTRTGFADFRVDAKYHRAEVQIVGNFDKAVGIEFKAQPSGET